MHKTPRWPLPLAFFLAAPFAVVACSDPGPANPPPQPTAEPTVAPTATAAPVPTAEPTAAPSAEPSAAPSASASAAPDKPRLSGRPPVLLSDPKSITDTFGFSPGAKLELGDKEIATLRIPEGGFTTATNVTFALDGKCKTTGLVFGRVYKVTPAIPPESKPVSVASNNGSPFVLFMPTGKKKDLNLAIGTFGKDARGNDNLTWKIVPAKNQDEANALAEFHLDPLPDACLHLTNKAITP